MISQATATSHGGLSLSPASSSTHPTHVASDSTAQRSVSRAITLALAFEAGSPVSRSAQKSTASPPTVVATLNAPKASPTTRNTIPSGSRGPPARRAMAW